MRLVASFQHTPATGTPTVNFDDLSFATQVPDVTTTSTTSVSVSTTTSTTLPVSYPGTGKPASECYVTLAGIAATGTARVDCVDGDPACDADGAVDGSCTFGFRVCVAQALSGCQATSITSVKASPASKAIAVPAVPASEPTCGPDTGVVVPLRRQGRGAGKLTLTFVAKNSVKPKLDRDRLRLRCMPPS